MVPKKKTSYKNEAQASIMMARWKEWWVPAAVIGFIIISSLMLVIPGVTTTLETRDEIKRQEVVLENLVKKRTRLQQLDDALLEQRLDLLTLALPNSKPILQMFLTLQDLASSLDVRLSQYSLSPGIIDEAEGDGKSKISSKELQSIELSLTIAGGLENVNAFVEEVQIVNPIMEIAQVKTGEAMAIDQSLDHETKMELLIYYSMPPQELGKLSTALKALSERDEEILTKLEGFRQFQKDFEMPALQPVVRDDMFSF